MEKIAFPYRISGFHEDGYAHVIFDVEKSRHAKVLAQMMQAVFPQVIHAVFHETAPTLLRDPKMMYSANLYQRGALCYRIHLDVREYAVPLCRWWVASQKESFAKLVHGLKPIPETYGTKR